MDDFDQRLTNVLTRAGEQADPAVARLRDPAVGPRPARPRPGLGRHPLLLAATSAVAVAAVVIGVALSVPRSAQHKPVGPVTTSVPAGPVRGKPDGKHPLWVLHSAGTAPSGTFDHLPDGGQASLPLPYVVNPFSAPANGATSALFTAVGKIEFPASRNRVATLLAVREKQIFVVLDGVDQVVQDGFSDARVEVVQPDNTYRELFRAARATSMDVSPDGTMLALSDEAGGAVTVVDVATGRVVHRLPGHFNSAVWASDTALVLSPLSSRATALAWRAPWTGAPEPIGVRPDSAQLVAGGMVALDETTGCLQRLDATATVTAANCDGWRSTGGASPDGRYLPVTWGKANAEQDGYLDLSRNEVRPWPVRGELPRWLGNADVLLVPTYTLDKTETARCDLTVGRCTLAPNEIEREISGGASWIGS